MTWLVGQMWIVLGAASLLALLLGWSLRGAVLVSRLRQAQVERELTKVELAEAREEIERLFAAQRKMAEAGTTPAAAPADAALAQELAAASEELARTREELAALKASPAPVMAAAPVAAAAAPAIAAAEAHEALKAHAKTLEEQIAALEAELAEARASKAAAETSVPASEHEALQQANHELTEKLAELEARLAAAPPPAAEPAKDLARLVWSEGYLRQRAQALEAELARQPAAVPAAAVSTPPAEAAPEPAPAAEPAPEPEQDEAAAEVEEELARLRWRNRYLEGRLAYFEGDAESVAQELAESGEGHVESAEETRASEAILGQLEEADARADEEQIVPARPIALERPVEGAPDDLTLIGGIGPKIQEVLNTLGIFHYDQIADWTPENVAWVDDYLSFGGRISREGWVEQAAVLVGEGAGP